MGDEKRSDTEKEQKAGFPQPGAVHVIIAAGILVLAAIVIAQVGFQVNVLDPPSASMALGAVRPAIVQNTIAGPAIVQKTLVRPTISIRPVPAPTCAAPTTLCGDSCTDTAADRANCGTCGKSCPLDRECSNGVCTCTSGRSDCGGICTDLKLNSQNCGTCGKSCPLDRECSNGACTCMNGRSDCGTCVDLNQDSRNCGACGTTCDGSAFCESGACRCRTGYKECGGTCIPESQQGITCNGICVNPQTDTGNCGECNHKCSDTYPTCTNGVCVGGGGCFIETTAVATYDSFVPISLIQAGDRIPGYDTSTGHVINRTITEVLIHRNEAVLRLEFTNDTIICTPIQPFYTGTWTPASELVAGDRVLCRDNHWEVLVNDPLPAGERDVYNLHGSPNQSYYTSYFVGRSQLLVHNMKVAKG